MARLAVVTPSFGPDVHLFASLHRSVLRHTDPDVTHHVIVPPRDIRRFGEFEGPRCRIISESDLLPPWFCRLPRPGWWANLRRPWPPVRGWVLQQALNFAAASQIDADIVLIADSDIVFVRPVRASRFETERGLSLYRLDNAVHSGMKRHVRWHQAARRMLGLPPPSLPPLHDYVSSLNVWSPSTVQTMLERITDVTGRHWMDAITSELHVSEFTLYGVFVDEIMSAGTTPPAACIDICHDYWDVQPLNLEGAYSFVNRLPPRAVGMMISSKSHTPHDVRRAAIERSREIVDRQPIGAGKGSFHGDCNSVSIPDMTADPKAGSHSE